MNTESESFSQFKPHSPNVSSVKKTLNGIYKSDKSEEDEEIKTLYFY